MSTNISLKDFLKTYTAISNKFIDEYYQFYEQSEINKFGIKIQDVMKYLGINNQDKFEERLRNNFILKNDYEIIRYIKRSKKNVKEVQYMLSFEGFERVCMASSTEKGKAFRDYFIMLRKFIDYYKDHIANKINELAKKNNKCVYILMVNKDKNILKFGRSDHIRERLKSYESGKETHPDVKFIMIVKDAKKVENCVKLFVKDYKYKGNKELYKMDFDILKETIFGCTELNGIVDKSTIDKMKDSKKYDTYVVYDDSKNIEYIDLKGNVVGYEAGHYNVKKLKTKKQSVKLNSSKTKKNT